MRYYYDTEFLEDGETIDLISIAIVAEDGREYYAASANMNWARIRRNNWLMENVVPHLPPDSEWKPKSQIRQEVREFLAHGVHGIRDIPELWAWYGAYDHIVLAQLFGRMLDLPNHIPMWTNDVRQELHRLGNPGLPAQIGSLHDALADARHVRVMHEYLINYARQKGRL